MRVFLSLVSVVGVSWTLPQLQFGGPTDVDTRSFSEADSLSGRVPGAPSVGSAPAPSVQVTNEVRHFRKLTHNTSNELMFVCFRISVAASPLIWTVLICTQLWMTSWVR